MLAIFLKTLPFFALIGLGWFAGRIRFFPQDATAWLTKFVFYFALPAMLFRFAGSLDIRELFDLRFALAYLIGSLIVWAIGFGAARLRGLPTVECAMEAHTGMTGNTGFLGVPMLAVLLGERAIGPIMLLLVIDLIIFSSLVTMIVAASRQGRLTLAFLPQLLRGIISNPMIAAMIAGVLWSALALPLWQPFDEFLALLGNAATPGALFAIGASLAGKSAERLGPAIWLSFTKLIIHPLAVGTMALMVFHVEPFAAGVMIAASALPVAGNVYILAQYFGVAVQRVSTAILISTAASIITVPLVIHWITGG